jgi:hypothetical protein
MTRLPYILTSFCCAVVGCGTSGGYGEPTDATMIELVESGGFAGPSNSRGVRIEGTTATYHSVQRTGQADLSDDDVAAIIAALEEIEFLELEADYTTCDNPGADFPSATVDVSLDAGEHTVRHYLGCIGGVFDRLAELDQQIFDLSGFTTWVTVR